jgi:hypothetical protein
LTRLRFISLFVPNLAQAVAQYSVLLQIVPAEGTVGALTPHPFAVKGPVVFEMGEVLLALYECDGATTHPGDVGFGLEGDIGQIAARMKQQGGTVFFGPGTVPGSDTNVAIGMMPDRHFFEVVEPAPDPNAR